MAKNSIDGGVFGLAAKLLGMGARTALKPVIKPIQEEVAHTLDNTFGHKVVKREGRPGFRVDDIKWNMAKNEPEIKWIYAPNTPAEEKVFGFEKENHRFVQVTVKEK